MRDHPSFVPASCPSPLLPTAGQPGSVAAGHGEPPRPDPAGGILSVRGFELALGYSLDLLSGVHTGVTLMAISWPEQAPLDVEAAAAAALLPLGNVGRLPDGRIGVAYLGPRGHDDAGATALSAYVRRRLQMRLSEVGFRRDAERVRVVAVHEWTDRVAGARALIAALPAAA